MECLAGTVAPRNVDPLLGVVSGRVVARLMVWWCMRGNEGEVWFNLEKTRRKEGSKINP